MKTAATSIFTYLFSILNYKTEQKKIMGSCYSGDHTAKDHIHTGIICNIDEPRQKYRLGTVSNKLQGDGGGDEWAAEMAA